jgi:imidazolonepropionase-like amidohydrolase
VRVLPVVQLGYPGVAFLDDLQMPPALCPALAAHTIAAARAAGKATRASSLEPGKLADLTVLDTDPVTAAPQHLGTIGLTQTWIGGTLRYQRP